MLKHDVVHTDSRINLETICQNVHHVWVMTNSYKAYMDDDSFVFINIALFKMRFPTRPAHFEEVNFPLPKGAAHELDVFKEQVEGARAHLTI